MEPLKRPASAYRKVFNTKTWSDDLVETNEPEFFVRTDATSLQPQQVRPKKKVAISQRDKEALMAMQKAEGEKEHTELAPREVIQTEEGSLIQNYEVDFGPEEEIMMAGGIRGIRALRVQRQAIEEQIAVKEGDLEAKAGLDRFAKYGGKISG